MSKPARGYTNSSLEAARAAYPRNVSPVKYYGELWSWPFLAFGRFRQGRPTDPS